MIYFIGGSYELDFLNNFYSRIKIVKAKAVNYIFNNKNKVYHPDFYLPDINTIIEIKSTYIFLLEYDQNILKQNACIENDKNFLFIIDKDYSVLEKILYLYNETN